MSGRTYDQLGCKFYICIKCGSKKDTISSSERNFNGPYCKKCKNQDDFTPNEEWNKYEFTDEEKQEIDNTPFENGTLDYYKNNYVRFDLEYIKATLEAKRKILIKNKK